MGLRSLLNRPAGRSLRRPHVGYARGPMGRGKGDGRGIGRIGAHLDPDGNFERRGEFRARPHADADRLRGRTLLDGLHRDCAGGRTEGTDIDRPPDLNRGFCIIALRPLTSWLHGWMSWREVLLIYASMHMVVCLPVHFRLPGSPWGPWSRRVQLLCPRNYAAHRKAAR